MKKKCLSALMVNLYLLQGLVVLIVLLAVLDNVLGFIEIESENTIIGMMCLAIIFFTFVASVVLAVINIVAAVRLQYKAEEIEISNVFRDILRYKLGLIPFFVINYALWAFAVGVTFNPFLMALWLFIPYGVTFAFLIMAATSAYLISYLFLLAKRGIITLKQRNTHAILQLIFIADVFDTIYLRKMEKGFQG